MSMHSDLIQNLIKHSTRIIMKKIVALFLIFVVLVLLVPPFPTLLPL
jgi:hypothetical protein